MDTSVGSTFSYLPGTVAVNRGTENAEISNSSEGQSRSPGASSSSSVIRFKIRSAKDRQQNPEPNKLIKATGKRNSLDSVDHTITIPSQDLNTSGKIRRSAPELIVASKDSELQVNSKMSDVTREEPFFTLTSNTKERMERREVNLNRSRSLDWREAKDYLLKLEPTKPITQVRSKRSMENSTSLNNHPSDNVSMNAKDKSKEQASLSNSVYLKIQPQSTVDKGKLECNEMASSTVSGSSPAKMGQVAIALERTGGYGYQSLPSRLRSKQSDSPEERKNLWLQYGQSLKPDLEEKQHKSWVSGAKVNEVTGNRTIMDRIERLYGSKGPENITDANSRDSLQAKHNSAVSEWLSRSNSANSVQKRPTNDPPFRSPPPSSVSQWSKPSNETEKSGTFPRRSNKGEINMFSFTLDTPTVSPKNSKNEIVSTMPAAPRPAYPEQSPPGRDSTCLPSNSEMSGTSNTESSTGLRNEFIDRARSKTGGATFPRAFRKESLYSTVQSSNVQQNSNKEMERNRQEVKITDSLQNRSTEESPRWRSKDVTIQPKPQFVRSATVDCERHKEDETVLELGSLKDKKKGREGFLERAPSLDSVRNTIHKFEALVQQTQTPSKPLLPRRTLSVPEKPKPVAGVIKSNSDKSLSVCSTRNLSESLFGKSDTKEEVLNSRTTTDKGRLTTKTSSRVGDTQEPEDTQTFNLVTELPSHQRNDNKDTIKDGEKVSVVKHHDEPDLSKDSHHNLDTVDSFLQNDFSATVSQVSSKKVNEGSDVCHSDVKDLTSGLSKSDSMSLLDGGDTTPTGSPGRISVKDSLETKIKEVKSSNSVIPASVPPISVKTTLSTATNGMQPRTPSTPISNTTVCKPVQVITSNSSGLDTVHNTARKEKVNSKVFRWFSNEGDAFKATDDYNEDDEDDEGTEREDDSDSGESSVTITSNMSQSDHRSFSLSFADLCNLGGLDYTSPESGGFRGEERWMSRRSASLSSDISVLSSVTLLGTEELDCLLDDVRGLGEETLQNYEDVQVVVLHKEEGSGLGFTLAGGVDQNKPVTVHRLLPYGAASHEGSIHEGDQVLSINGTALHNSAHWEALRTLRKARARAMAVVVIRRGDITETQHSVIDTSPKPTEYAEGSRMRVTLTKSSWDLGFSLEGGVGSSLGDKPLTVQRLFQGGPIGKVFPGDELLELQGQSLGGLRRLEAWNLIKKLPPGPVEVLLNRPHKLH